MGRYLSATERPPLPDREDLRGDSFFRASAGGLRGGLDWDSVGPVLLPDSGPQIRRRSIGGLVKGSHFLAPVLGPRPQGFSSPGVGNK